MPITKAIILIDIIMFMLEAIPDGVSPIHSKKIRTSCPHCKTVAQLIHVSNPNSDVIRAWELREIIAGYACTNCKGPVPLIWKRDNIDGNGLYSSTPKEILPSVISFELTYVPPTVQEAILEALKCLSVDAHNAFAAMCRRAIQVICEDLGADTSSKVEKQINELKEMAGLDDEVYVAVKQIMLGGHDGVHPQLPPVDQARARILVELLNDVVHQLYRRRGKIKEAEEKRKRAIAAKR